MAGKIFINYRRGDDPGHTGRLFDRLQDVFEPQQLFLDVDNIAPGLDFVRVLNERVAECDVVLAVIGKNWIDARDAAGTRRLDDPDDFVRIEITSALNQGKRVIPVLVGDAPMPRPEDLPEALRPLARRNAVRLTHERFRADTQGLVKALQQSLEEIEARRRADADAARRAQAEQERQRVAKEEEARKKAEEAALLARQEAYHRTSMSDDPAVLRSFLASYDKGPDVDQVRKRLRLLEPKHGWSLQSPILKFGAPAFALALVLVAGAVVVWPLSTSPPPPTQPSAATPPPAAQSVAAQSVNGTLPVPSSGVAVIPPGPSPDRVAWDLIKETTDEAALKRFAAEYPDSPLRKDAEARIAALDVAQAAKPAPPSTEQIAWDLVKASKDLDELRRFLDQFPNTDKRADAEQLIAAVAAEAQRAAPVSVADPHELARSLQFELKRVGCFDGAVNGEFDAGTQAAWQKFAKFAAVSVTDDTSMDAIRAVRGINTRVCPLLCPTGQHVAGERCIGDAPAQERADAQPHQAKPNRPAAPRGSGKCFSFQGRNFCE
jgi:hypothetical protein